MNRPRNLIASLLLLGIASLSCGIGPMPPPQVPVPTTSIVAEYPVTEIPLDGPVPEHKSELSGLAW
jgi:hypothetical protein